MHSKSREYTPPDDGLKLCRSLGNLYIPYWAKHQNTFNYRQDNLKKIIIYDYTLGSSVNLSL